MPLAAFAAGIAVAASDLPELTPAKRDRQLDELFKYLNPEAIGKEYADALKNGDREAAIRVVARYYRERPASPRYRTLTLKPADLKRADQAVRGEVSSVNIPWRFPGGRIDFLFDPTAIKGPRNHEWLWQLNRHGFWGNMAAAYSQSGKKEYAAAFNLQMRDWIAQTEPPEKWNGPGSAWRTIETGLRLMGSWPLAFEVFRKAPEVSDETLCLMLGSMHRQAVHVMEHKTGGNWLMMEMNGAYFFGTLYPEFKDAEAIRTQSSRILTAALRDQILPDGMQNELSPDYHAVTFNCAFGMYELGKMYQRTAEFPPDFAVLMEKAADAYLALATPGLTQPRTNDTYTKRTGDIVDSASRLFPGRREFRWVAEKRAGGEAPAGPTASRMLPYAGFIAMRSDWGPEAAYLCFDVGPLGAGHMHQDKLNINLYQGDEELIFDDGGGQYESSPTRQYGISAAGHNTVLVDGEGQNRPGPLKLKPGEKADAVWGAAPEYDYARAAYTDEFGPKRLKPATHTREVRFFKPDFFCVVDTLRSRDGEAHDYELLFQLDTLKLKPVPEFPGALRSEFGKKYDVLILPLLPDGLEVTTVSGQLKPRVAGWYVGRNDTALHPATTVSMKLAGRSDGRFATLLIPLRAGEELPTLNKRDGNCFELTWHGRTEVIKLDDLSVR